MADNPVTREDEWKQAASQAIAKLARSGQPFSAADLIAMVGSPPAPSLPATVFRGAHLNGLIERDGAARLGTVWVGKAEVKEPRERAGPGRRKVDRQRVPDEIWSDAHTRAKADGVPTSEVVARAVRAHLKKKKS